MANLEPRVLIGRIYVGDHYTLLHTKYISSGPHGFREDFLSFSHYKTMGANDPWGVANLDPRQDLGRRSLNITSYLIYHNLSALSLMVSEKKIFEGSLPI